MMHAPATTVQEDPPPRAPGAGRGGNACQAESPGQTPPRDEGGQVVVLGKYVDALYASVRGELRDGFAEYLEAMKETLRDSGGGEEGASLAVPGLPGGPLRLQPVGRGKYRYVLDGDALRLEITDWANLPALLIQFKARVLYEHDLAALEAMVDEVAGFFLEPGFEVLVSRFDLAVDFQGGEGWEPPHVDDIVCRAREPVVYYRRVGDRPRPTTMTYGKPGKRGKPGKPDKPPAPLQVQIYDKTEKLKEEPEKGWMRDVWRGSPGYAEGRDVWRVEYRYRRKKLNEFGINTIADLRERVGNLVRAVVGGEGTGPWIRAASPETRGFRQDRRPAAPWWDEILAASLEGRPATVALDGDLEGGPDLEHTRTMLFAYLEKYMALGGGEGLHPVDTPLKEFTDLLAEEYSDNLDSKGISRAEAINARRFKMGLEPIPAGPPVASTDRC